MREEKKACVVPYAPHHRAAVRYICCATGLLGFPMWPYFGNPDLFADLFSLYYTDFFSEASFVLKSSACLGGYILGCYDTEAYQQEFKKKIVPLIIKKLLAGKYGFSPRTLFHIAKRIEQLKRKEHMLLPPLSSYPAHLHINLLPSYRGQGYGKKLMESFLEKLSQKNIKGVHLGTTSLNREAVAFYQKLGFQLYARQRTYLFREYTSSPAYNLIFVKAL